MKSPLIAIIVALGAAFSTYADVLKIKKMHLNSML